VGVGGLAVGPTGVFPLCVAWWVWVGMLGAPVVFRVFAWLGSDPGRSFCGM